MRAILLLYSLFLFGSPSIGQTETNSTKVYIVGTIHTGNKYFGSKKLVKELKKIDPNIILVETSNSFKKVFGLRTANFLRIWHPGIEQLALQKYKSKKADFKVLPFDTLIINRNVYRKELHQNTQKVFNLLLSTSKSKEDSIALLDFLKEYNSYYQDIFNKSLEEINLFTTVDRTRRIEILEDSIIAKQLIKYSKDTMLNKWYFDGRNFWKARNNYMVEQIKKITLANTGQIIVVLTGLNHKYYLVDNLKNISWIRIMELNEK